MIKILLLVLCSVLLSAQDTINLKHTGKEWYNLGVKAIHQKDTVRARYCFKQASYLSHADAQYNYASMLFKGTSGAVDKKSAIEWLKKSANKNNADAQYTLAIIYLEGIEDNFSKLIGMTWLKSAVKLKHKKAIVLYNKLKVKK